ncbi:carboxylesterase/lipase family protein [Microbacterium excoecariae]|uniref:carboxylesterase/lipase family protein n=1 Tax=Microbacterium excoecariae TaxID=2715210 RepID=UPI00140C39BD|nr:carboxylesterase family protein [Microbacterium excoecariae]NHI15708.1 carboxylesterase family protein [Microbacterium excoecariae]
MTRDVPTEIRGVPLIDGRTSPRAGRSDPLVATSAGRVRGFWRGDCATFLGIPYAAAPVGQAAYEAPVPHAGWDGIRDATRQGATPQRGDNGVTLIPEPSVPGRETLNVNVFTPDPSRRAGLPVVVYIHGGAYSSGSIASPWYDGASFARDGVVTVTLSYRIAHAGFAGVRGAPHNRGVRDWLLALAWVRENARAFGGDPDRVTLAGQSAGGGAVLTLLGIPAARGLFHSAWSMSPTLAHLTAEDALRLGDRIAAEAGCANTPAALAALPRGVLSEAQKPHIRGGSGPSALRRTLSRGLHVGPVVDGDLIPHPTLEALAGGEGASVPLVIGSTDDEFSMVLDRHRRALRFLPAAPLLALVGLHGARRRAYRRANGDVRGTANVLGRYATDALFRRHVAAVTAARGPERTWTYRFSWPSPATGWAMHCLDVPFFFDVPHAHGVARIAGDNPPAALVDAVHGSATRFARTGAPGWDAALTRVFDVETRDVTDGYASVTPLASPA